MAFNLFGLGKKKGPNAKGPQTDAATTIMESKPTKAKKAVPTKLSATGMSLKDLMGGMDLTKQLKMLGGILLVVVTAMAGFIWKDNQDAAHGSYYVAASGEIRVLSQRIAKTTTQALQGDQAGFTQLRDSLGKTNDLLNNLMHGGEIDNATLPPSPEAVRGELDELNQVWTSLSRDADLLLEQEKRLVALGREVGGITGAGSRLQQQIDQFIATRSGRELSAAQQMLLLSQRISKGAGALLIGENIDAEAALNLSRDTSALREYIAGFKTGNDKATALTDEDGKKRLAQLEKVFSDDLAAVTNILSNIQPLVKSKQAGSRVLKETEHLLERAGVLTAAYQAAVGNRAGHFLTLSILTALAVTLIAAMAKAFFDDTAQRARHAEKQSHDADNTNRANQDAILRLMNELGDLADGDLTVTATVTEDITGAIADSINYTIEELRVLVGRINDAASRVTHATESAQRDSAELLAAAERQSKEIQTAGRAVLEMSRSMNMVSSHATQSAQVARQSLNAAEKGAGAVQDSIKGMNEIRGQIQETSKRIKRLGESSQEIGEIVELISDITEQTNVLALNAAIQAASAGEAGRGFTVVAEEVQRLAERSAEATKQIAAIVKTIQTDTHDAISAMEQSTQGVVEGAKLSDAAGQALSEIGQVSRNLAQLIENISTATQKQAQSAAGVAENMQGILRITEQTTVGTQKTATIVGELASLASELKGSVAGFKVN
jgi:twitching motility protein PilJ